MKTFVHDDGLLLEFYKCYDKGLVKRLKIYLKVFLVFLLKHVHGIYYKCKFCNITSL